MDNSRLLAFFTVMLLLPSLGYAQPPVQADSTDFSRWYESLRQLRPDPTRGAVIADVTLERDAATLYLASGQVHLVEAIDGRTVGAVFVGSGELRMTAPEAVERDQIELAFGSPEIATPFRSAILFFTDFTLIELQGSAEWHEMNYRADARRELEEALDYIVDDDGWLDPHIAVPLINDTPGFFYAHVAENRDDPLIFISNPHSFEEVSLSRRADREKRREVVAQFHRQADYAIGSSIPQEALDFVALLHYDIETEIENNLDLVGRATAQLRRVSSTVNWIPFQLYEELEVDSVSWGDGSPAPFFRGEETSDLWIEFSDVAADSLEITFHYHGDMMDRVGDITDSWVQISSHRTWFPMVPSSRAAPYRITFHAPDRYVVTAVGQQTEHTVVDERVTRVWETPPITMMTFNIGEFDEYNLSDLSDPRVPPMKVLLNELAHFRLGEALGLLEQRDMAETVASDLANSFRFYNDVYGPTTVQDFVVTEIPYSHGEAYSGLVMLAWNTFQWTDDQGFNEMFRAHEVAHQWWGIGVTPATYRDWWLAEGFSEFSGWWYAARARGSIDRYLDRLEETREELLDRRGKTAPIAVGRRAGTSEFPQDYELVVYHKGAWVLHMLRTLLSDPEAGGEDVFEQVMKTFYTRHLGGTATTNDFQRVVEEVVGAPLDWFFEQWVFGTAIPTYTFSHKFEQLPDGLVKATVRIRQEDVPEDFRMIVPILVDFGDEGSAMVRVNVVGSVTETELPLLPREPDDIVFNPSEAVLAETRTERWRER